MIQPGLARITRLLRDTPLPWRAVHVAGTNGKTTVCHFLQTLLHSHVHVGTFVSPHLVDR